MQTTISRVAGTALLSLALLTLASAQDAVQVAYQEPLGQLTMTQGSGVGVQKPNVADILAVQFFAYGRQFDIDLEPNRALIDAAQRFSLDNQVAIYRGEFANMRGSWARLVFENGLPQGMLWDGREMWAVEIGVNEDTGESEPYIYRLEDLQIPFGALTCSDVSSAQNGAQLAEAILADPAITIARAFGATSQIDLAMIGDFEFTGSHGASVDTAILARMNNVDGIFSAQLGVQINVNRIDTFASSNDPFSDETDSAALLGELGSYRASSPAQSANGLTHLFTGRDLDGTTVGIAYGGGLCTQRFSAGLTQATHSATLDSLIAAHEIGHNFGAPHDGATGSACSAMPQTFLMAPQLNGSDQFSACSIAEMQSDVSSASCVTAMPITDVEVVAGTQPGNVLLGNAGLISFEANNAGTTAATGVNVEITIPSGINVTSATVNAVTCTTGAGAANCAIGTIATGTGVTVNVAVVATTVGPANFVATIIAAVDNNSSNNQANFQLTVDPAVDLVATAAATIAQVEVSQSATVSPRVENRSTIPATGVRVTITPNSGIVIDSASWAPGTCSISNDIATCQAAALAAQSNDTIQLQIAGVTAGTHSYAMSVTGTEFDRLTSNNSSIGQFTVAAAAAVADSSGGGGSFAPLTILMLLLVRLLAGSAMPYGPREGTHRTSRR
jgi:hypothetical protein